MTKRNSTSINSSAQVIKRTVYGVGYNSGGKHPSHFLGRPSREYGIWKEMIGRCYGERLKARLPTYKNCTVAPEWHDFQVFAEWYKNNLYLEAEYCLDKDILIKGNKIYSANTCCLVPHEINCLLTDSGKSRGDYPQGVSFEKTSNKFQANIRINGRQKKLGRFDCPHKAHEAYVAEKEAHVKTKADEWRYRIDARAYLALMAWTATK